MLWVAIDRGESDFKENSDTCLIPAGIRIADKRSLPCPNRMEWYSARDDLYEQIMQKAWDKEKRIFGQSYDETHVLDSAVLIMPLVFFSTAVSFSTSSPQAYS